MMLPKKSAIAPALLTGLLVMGLFAVLAPTAVAQCPQGCVQRQTYCDCPSQDPNASISTACSEDYACPFGFVCSPEGLCIAAGGEERVSAPEGDFTIVALIFAMAGFVFLFRK